MKVQKIFEILSWLGAVVLAATLATNVLSSSQRQQGASNGHRGLDCSYNCSGIRSLSSSIYSPFSTKVQPPDKAQLRRVQQSIAADQRRQIKQARHQLSVEMAKQQKQGLNVKFLYRAFYTVVGIVIALNCFIFGILGWDYVKLTRKKKVI